MKDIEGQRSSMPFIVIEPQVPKLLVTSIHICQGNDVRFDLVISAFQSYCDLPAGTAGR